MYYTGFADEASTSIDKQIKVTKELGWKNIELRNIDGTNIINISDKEFELVNQKLDEAGIKVSSLGSTIANWGKSPDSEEDFQKSLLELKRAIPRMKKLGTKMIRGMSFGIPKNFNIKDNSDLEKKIIKKLKIFVEVCENEDIIYLHENCMNYFSQSYEHMDRLLDEIDSQYFKIVFDTGNPVFSDNKIGEKPYNKQTTWESYQHLKRKIKHIHIKDAVFIENTNDIFPKSRFTYPGEGNGMIIKVLKDLFINGYDGGISIEPHMASVYHNNHDLQKQDHYKYKIYLEYGKRIMDIVEKIKQDI